MRLQNKRYCIEFLRLLLILSVLGLLAEHSRATAKEQNADSWSLQSPDKQLAVTVTLADLSSMPGNHKGKRLYYRIDHGPADARVEVLPFSPLGIVRKDQAFVDGLKFVSARPIRQINETYEMPHGKRRLCRNHAQELILTFKNRHDAKLNLILRAYNDGIAFRYCFPEKDKKRRTVTAELTGFRIPADSRVWIQPYQEAGQYTPAYEDYYLNGIRAGTASPEQSGWALPALFKLGNGQWVLLAEALIDGSYCGTRLAQQAPDGLYRVRLPDVAEGN
ncbi:MAG: glycoside hydrolase family 97 N-terminal domain-containing protein, partial [Pirellulales bacterium]|nr:glycoside hydrolase family 97 N-terminal domain-containing protein [Pirellulales bacterium]